MTRSSRGAGTSHVHRLTIVMPIPHQKVIFIDLKTKWHLIALIVDDFCKNVAFLI